MKDFLATILIVNYNNSNYLIKSIKSVLNQSYKNKEIIFYDDFSTDDSFKKIYNFKKKNKLNFKLILNNKKKKKNPIYNQIKAIKNSISISKGKYIFFLDSDDFFKKDKISKVMKIFNRDKTKKFILDQPIFKFKSKEIEKKYRKSLSKRKWPKFPPTSCMCFEKKTLINSIKKLDLKNFPNLGLDFRLAVYYHIILNNFYILDSHYTIYRQLTGSVDHKYRKKFFSKNWWKRRDEAFEFLNKLLKKNNIRTNNGLDYLITKLFNKILNK
jgi:glycosyltransferase involved in cell wall biosynthesis